MEGTDSIQANRWKTPFFTIWAGQAVSLMGSGIARFALIWWLTEETGSATVLATTTFFALLPQIVLGPIAGALVDRWSRRRVMIVADAAIALVSLWLAWLFWSGSIAIWHVYLIMLARELGGIFHWPAMQASTSLMVPKEHLARVSGVNQAMYGALSIVGPAAGALLLTIAPMHSIMFMDVVTASLAITPLLFVAIPQPLRAAGPDGAKPSMIAELREGMRYLFGWRGLVIIVAAAMLFKIALTPAFSLLPLLVKDHFGRGAGELAGLEMAVGVGTILGGLLLGVWGGFKRRIATTMLGLTLIGLLMLVLGALPPAFFPVALAVMLVMGVSIALTDGPLFAVLQGSIAPEIQGRVFMLFGSLITLTSPVGLLIAGPVTDVVGIQVWYVVAGLLCLLAGIAAFFMPSVMNIEQHQAATSAAGEPAGDPALGSPLAQPEPTAR
ncbi:MAG: MFS transporter [Chloroflexota bacterium]